MKQKTGNVSHTEKEDKIIPCSVLPSSFLSLSGTGLTSVGEVVQDLPSAKDIPAGLATEKSEKLNSLYECVHSFILVTLCSNIQLNYSFSFKFFGISFALEKRVFARRQ